MIRALQPYRIVARWHHSVKSDTSISEWVKAVKTLRANMIQFLAALTLFAAVVLLLLLLGAC